MRLDHLLSREKWLRRLNRILGRASGEARAEAEVRNSGEAPQNNRRKAGYDLTEFLIETLYRFEGSDKLKNLHHGGLAQLEERVLCKHEVIGSSPIFSTKHGLIAQLVRAHA